MVTGRQPQPAGKANIANPQRSSRARGFRGKAGVGRGPTHSKMRCDVDRCLNTKAQNRPKILPRRAVRARFGLSSLLSTWVIIDERFTRSPSNLSACPAP